MVSPITRTPRAASRATALPKIIALLAKAEREPQVEDAYMKLVGAHELERPYGCDGMHGGVLFEFKHDERLDGPAGMRAIAQAAYYVHHLVMGGVYKERIYAPPTVVAVCDKNQALCFPATRLEALVHREFAWTRPASSPDPALIAAVTEAFADLVVYDMTTTTGAQAFVDALAGGEAVLQRITHENFDRIFAEWRRHFAADTAPQEAALAFLLDLQRQGIVDEASGRVVLRCEVATGGTTKYFDIRVPIAKYTAFWATYQRPPSNEEMAKIIERKDRLVVMQLRRTTGEFFTPLAYAALAHQYLAEAIPDRYVGQGVHHSMYDDYHWWDPCCGTGNLTLDCPPTMQGKLFMSTLNQEDVDVIRASGQNQNAEIFAYDFLNPIELLGQPDRSLPASLRAALADGKPWIFLLNPPYAGGVGGQYLTGDDEVRAEMSNTAVGARMREMTMGLACRNPMSQFVHRITELTDAHGLRAHMGIFSKGILWTGPGLVAFREHFRARFAPASGFCFHCAEFQGASGAWPVVYTQWQAGASDDEVVVDVIDNVGAVAGRKSFAAATTPLTKWVARPKGTVVRPPMNGALGIAEKALVDKQSPDAIASLYSDSNDVQHSTSSVFLTSGPNPHTGSWSVTPDNFHDSLVCFAARKLVTPTWLNDRDEFSVPDTAHADYTGFAADAIVWSLFHGSNQTSSLGNVSYKGQTYDIPNGFFWMTPEEMLAIDGLPRPIWQQCRTAQPRFVSRWLGERAEAFSPDAQEVLALGKELVRVSAPYRVHALPKFHLDRWDAGWYQLRMGLFGKKDVPFQQPAAMLDAMARFQVAHRALGDRLRPMIYTLGFLPSERLLTDTVSVTR